MTQIRLEKNRTARMVANRNLPVLNRGEFNQRTAPVQYGESVSDIINRPDTKPVLLQTVAVFAALGIGFGLFGYFAVDTLAEMGAEGGEDPFGMIGGLIAAVVIIFIAALAGSSASRAASGRTASLRTSRMTCPTRLGRSAQQLGRRF